MTTKSIPEQVVDEFIGQLLSEGVLGEDILGSLKAQLLSGTIRKDEIIKLLEKDVENDNPGA